MKKMISIVIVLLMLVVVLAGCVQQVNVPVQPVKQTETPTPTQIPAAPPTPKPELMPTPTESDSDSPFELLLEEGKLAKYSQVLKAYEDRSEIYISEESDWIYFIGSQDQGIYKIKSDGSKKTRISNDYIYDGVIVLEDFIYYHAYEYCEDGSSFIFYSMKTDGTDKVKIAEFFEMPLYYHISGDWIYYVNESRDAFYKSRLDGTEKTKLTDVGGFIFDTTVAYENYLYFNNDSKLKKINIDGGEEQVLIDNFDCSEMFISDGWIYFTVFPEYNIYKVRTDGTDKTKLNNDDSQNLIFSENDIYYKVPYPKKIPGIDISILHDQGYYLYKIGIDGKGRKRIGTLDPPDVDKQKIQPNNNGFDVTKLAGKKMSEIIRILGEDYTVSNDLGAKYEEYNYNSLGLYFTKKKNEKYPLSIAIIHCFAIIHYYDGNYGYDEKVNDKINIKGYGMDAFKNRDDVIGLLGKPDYAYYEPAGAELPDRKLDYNTELALGYKLKSKTYLEFWFFSDEYSISNIRIYRK